MFRVDDLSVAWVFSADVDPQPITQFESKWRASPKDVVKTHKGRTSVVWRNDDGVFTREVVFGHGEWESVAHPVITDAGKGLVCSLFKPFWEPRAWVPVSVFDIPRYREPVCNITVFGKVSLSFSDFFTKEETAPVMQLPPILFPRLHEERIFDAYLAAGGVVVATAIKSWGNRGKTVYVFRPETGTAHSFPLRTIQFADCPFPYTAVCLFPVSSARVLLVCLPLAESPVFQFESFSVRVVAWDERSETSEAVPIFTSEKFPGCKLRTMRVWITSGACRDSATMTVYDGDSLFFHVVPVMSKTRLAWLWACFSARKRT